MPRKFTAFELFQYKLNHFIRIKRRAGVNIHSKEVCFIPYIGAHLVFIPYDKSVIRGIFVHLLIKLIVKNKRSTQSFDYIIWISYLLCNFHQKIIKKIKTCDFGLVSAFDYKSLP